MTDSAIQLELRDARRTNDAETVTWMDPDDVRTGPCTVVEECARGLVEPVAKSPLVSGNDRWAHSHDDPEDDHEGHLFFGCDGGEVEVDGFFTESPIETCISYPVYREALDGFDSAHSCARPEFDLWFDHNALVGFVGEACAAVCAPVAFEWEKVYGSQARSGCGPAGPRGPSP